LSFNITQGTTLDFVDSKTRANGRLVSNGSSMMFTNDGSIYLDSTNSYIHLGANGEVDIDSSDETHTVDRIYEINANKIKEVANSKQSSISGNSSEIISGDSSKTVIGINQESYTKDSTATYLTKSNEIVGTGKDTFVALGGAKTTIVAGDYTITVGLGKITLMTAGGINLIAGVGGVNITSATSIKLTAPLINIATLAASIKTVALKVSPNIFGGGPFCAIPFCLFTGVPHTTSTYLGLGI